MNNETTYEQLGIKINYNIQDRDQKTICPKCSGDRKKKNDKSLSVNLTKGIWNCHHCNWSGGLRTKTQQMSRHIHLYDKPSREGMIKLTDKAKEYLLSRGITEEVMVANKLVSNSKGGIVFPYFKDGEMINYKGRAIGDKRFFQAPNCEPIMYNLDRVKDQEKIIICEGEFDSLSWEVAGYTSHTSVNMGAPNPDDKSIDRKLQCITNSYDVLSKAKIIYVAVDNDENGRVLQRELIRRFGEDKCRIVDFTPYKDANELLIAEGTEALTGRLLGSVPPKIEGVFSVVDIQNEMMDCYVNGQREGTTTYIPQIDEAWKWREGEVNLWTGYQNEGKSLFLNQLSVIKAFHDGWKFAVFSPENTPMVDFYNDLIEMYIGKSVNKNYNNYMGKEEFIEGMEFCNQHFKVIYPKKNFELDEIFKRAKYLVRTEGIRSLIIDPFNVIHHKMQRGEREDLYISRFMSELKRFAVDNEVSVHLVAHQNTPRKITDEKSDNYGNYPKPDLNNIKGGGTFADKADNVMYVQRPERGSDFKSTKVTFGSQKIKKQKLVGIPQDIEYIDFDRASQRYIFEGWSPLFDIDELKKQVKELQ